MSLFKKSSSKNSLDSLATRQNEMSDVDRRSSSATFVNPESSYNSSNPLGLATLQKGVKAPKAEKNIRFPIKYEAARHAARFFEIVCLIILFAVINRQDTATVNSMNAYGSISLATASSALSFVAVLVFICCHFLHFFARFKKTLTSRKLLISEGLTDFLIFVLLVASFSLCLDKSTKSGLCGVGVSPGCDLFNWVIAFLILSSFFFLSSTIIDISSFYYGVKNNQMNDVELAMTLRRMSKS